MRKFISLEDNPRDNSVLCSSGVNYIVVQSDGKIHRCFKDITTISDVSTFPRGMFDSVRKCDLDYCCDSSSDQMFCTQWNVKKFNQKKDYCSSNPVAINWKESDKSENVIKDSIYIVVYLTNRCNFNCPYCCAYYPKSPLDKRPTCPEISTQEWILFFYKLKKQYQNVQIQFNGGEPLLRSGFDILLEKCIELGFNVDIVSNFSLFHTLDRIYNISNPEKINFSITLHPLNKGFDFDRSLEYIKKFRDKGFKIRVVLLGWPEHKEYHEKWKVIFRDLGIDYWFKWCGGYSYTQDFIEYLCKEGAAKSTAEYLSGIKKVSHKDEITYEEQTDIMRKSSFFYEKKVHIDLILSSSLEDLRNKVYLKNILSNIQLLNVFCRNRKWYIWLMQQCVDEFSDLLIYLSQKDIKTFLNIGTYNGWTFSIMCLYLNRFCPLEKAITIDPDSCFTDYNDFKSIFPLIQETNETSNDYIEQKFDLCFIDGCHTLEWLKKDFDNVGKFSKITLFHDLYSRDWTDVKKYFDSLNGYKREFTYHNDMLGIGYFEVSI